MNKPEVNTERLVFARVSKTLAGRAVLHNLSFSVNSGEIVVLLGPNGAGKSTSILLASGLLTPDSGEISLCKKSLISVEARFHLGYCPQEPQFPNQMRVNEVFGLVSKHYPHRDQARQKEIIEAFSLQPLWQMPIQILSGGQRRSLALSLAFSGASDFVLLDEPTVGLDPEVRRKIWAYCRLRAAEGLAILMSTHYLDEAESLATRILLLKDGQILRSGIARDIVREFGYTRIHFSLPQSQIHKIPHAQPLLQGRYFIDTQTPNETLTHLLTLPGFEIESLKPLPLEEVLRELESETR